jgi:hypothetical protein
MDGLIRPFRSKVDRPTYLGAAGWAILVGPPPRGHRLPYRPWQLETKRNPKTFRSPGLVVGGGLATAGVDLHSGVHIVDHYQGDDHGGDHSSDVDDVLEVDADED